MSSFPLVFGYSTRGNAEPVRPVYEKGSEGPVDYIVSGFTSLYIAANKFSNQGHGDTKLNQQVL